jgi:hypothetical protein
MKGRIATMRMASLAVFLVAASFDRVATAQAAVTAPGSVPAVPTVPAPPVAPAPTPAAPPPAPASAFDSPYTPTDAVAPATTFPRSPDPRVWRLVDPAEADWRSPDPNRPRGWARVDTDGKGASGYVGGSFRIADGFAFAPFAHVTGTVVEPNLALTWLVGPLWLMPAVGTSLDFGGRSAISLDPQLFAALDAKLFYFEVWAQYFWASAYHSDATDTFALRGMGLYSISSTFGLGVEYDLTVATHNGPSSSLLLQIFGGRTNVRVGERDTVGLFIGDQFGAGLPDGVAGRLEYVHQW